MAVKKYNVGEVMQMLSDFNPYDDIMIVTSARKIGHITGLDTELMNRKSAIVLNVEYDEVIRGVEDIHYNIDNEIAALERLKASVDTNALNKEIQANGKFYKREIIENNKKEDLKTKRDEFAKTGLKRDIIQCLVEGRLPCPGRGRPRILFNTDPELKAKLTRESLERMTIEEFSNFVSALQDDYERNVERYKKRHLKRPKDKKTKTTKTTKKKKK